MDWLSCRVEARSEEGQDAIRHRGRHGLAAMMAGSPSGPTRGPASAGCYVGQSPERTGMIPDICRPGCLMAPRAIRHRARHGLAGMPAGTQQLHTPFILLSFKFFQTRSSFMR